LEVIFQRRFFLMLITITRPYYVSFHFGKSRVCVPDASNCVIDAFFKGFCLGTALIVVLCSIIHHHGKRTP
jgi:hypothetical protein